MQRYVLSLMWAGLAGLAWAAEVPCLPPPDCPQACAAPCAAKVCVPVPTVKKTDKVIYDCRCVDYCLPRCSLWSILQGGCGCGEGCPNCGQPRVRHVLIKRIVHEECPDVKCEVREAPCAPTP